jgi:tetratricopeptide (TPR) repeat protein
MMKALYIATLAAGILFSNTRCGAASYSHWHKAMDAAEEARKKRDFKGAEAILLGEVEEAAQLGLQDSSENSVALGFVRFQMGRYQEAIEVLDAALEKIGPDPRSQKIQIAQGFMLACKAETLARLLETDEALKYAEEGRKVLQSAVGRYHPELYILNALMGDIYYKKKNYAEAEKAYAAALKLSESPQFVTGTVWSGPEEDVRMYRLKGSKEGPLRMNATLGYLCMEQDKYKEAGEYFKKSLQIAESAYGKKNAAIVIPLEGMARLDLRQGRRADFEKDSDRIYEVATHEKGLELRVLNAFWDAFATDLKAGNDAPAASMAQKLATICAAQNFETRQLSTHALNIAGRENPDWARVAKVAAFFRDAAKTAYAAEPQKMAPMLIEFATFAEAGNQTAMAREYYEAIAKSQENAADKSMLISVEGKFADFSLAENKPADALPHLHRLSALLQQKYGDDSRVADALDREAATLKQTGQDAAAAEVQARANEVRKNALLKR